MPEEEIQKNKLRRKWFERAAFGFLYVGGAAFLYGFYAYIFKPNGEFILTDLGEFWGGAAGSLWALSGLLFIYVSYLGQKEEIELQRIELKNNVRELEGQKEQLRLQNETMMKQQFENTFFELLKIHRENVSLMEIKDNSNRPYKGKDLFEYASKVFTSTYNRLKKSTSSIESGYISLTIDISYQTLFYGKSSHILLEYLQYRLKSSSLYLSVRKNLDSIPHINFQNNLGSYFRHLYQTVKFVHEHPYFETSEESRYDYVKKIRAQLSDYELAILYLNSMSSLGRAWTDTGGVDLITEYALMKTLPAGFFADTQIDHRISYPEIQYEGYDQKFIDTDEYKNINDDIKQQYIIT